MAVEKVVEIIRQGVIKATKISIFIGLHRIRSLRPLLKSVSKTG
jgi:hypothetical protein